MTNAKDNAGIGKRCRNCGLPPGDTVVFRTRHTLSKTGFASKEETICRACEASIAKQYRQEHPDRLAKIKETHRDKNFGIRYHVQEKISSWRKASTVLSDLTVEYLIDLYYQQNGLCHYTGVPMVFGWVDGKIHSNTLSLDKIDPDKGYVIGNVAWCTYLVNTMKQNLSKNEFMNTISGIISKGKPMVATTSVEKLQQLSAHARLGSLAALVEDVCVKAAYCGDNKATLDVHESTTTPYPFTEIIGPHYREMYRQFAYKPGVWDAMMDDIVSDLRLVTGYNIERDTKPSTVRTLVLFLTIKW